MSHQAATTPNHALPVEIPEDGEPSLAHVWWQAIRRSLPLVLALALLGGVLGGAASLVLPKKYEATSEIVILPMKAETQDQLASASAVAKNLVSSYAGTVTSEQVLKAAIISTGRTDLTVADLAKMTSVDVPVNTVLIDVKVTDSDAQGAADLANAVSNSFIANADQVLPSVQGNSKSAVLVPSLVRSASVPVGSSSLGAEGLVPVGLFLGAALGMVLALTRRTK